jgi:hypothetical protein
MTRTLVEHNANIHSQVGKFVIGEPEGTDDIISEDQVPVNLRFPAIFKGQGVRGHRYHVFDEPRYYA